MRIFVILLLSITFTNCDRELSFTQPDPNPPTGKILVESHPPGYDIYLNGRISGGKTPFIFDYMESGTYDIELKSYYMPDTMGIVMLNDSGSENISFNMENDPRFFGSASISTGTVRSKILMNGEFTGLYTPDTIYHINPGEFNLTMTAMGCRDFSKNYFVCSSQLLSIKEEMDDTTLWVMYNSENSDLPTDRITTLGEGNLNILGTEKLGLLTYPDFRTYNPDNCGLGSFHIKDFAYRWRGDKKLVVVTDRGCFWGDIDGVWSNISERFSSIDSPKITAAAFDGSRLKETAFLCSASQGLITISGDEVTFTNTDNSILPNNLTCIDVVEPGYIVVGSVKDGVFIKERNQGSWINYKLQNGPFSYSEITAVGILDKSPYLTSNRYSVFAATSSGILYRYDNDEWEIISIATHYVTSICCGSDKATWIGSSNGIFRIEEGKEIIRYSMENSNLPTNSIKDVQSDWNWVTNEKKLYVATHRGYVIFKYAQ